MPPYLKCSGAPVAVFAPASCRPSTPDQRYRIIGNPNITSAAWRHQVMLGSFPMVRHAEFNRPVELKAS
jgi:hypothetical protein